MARPMSDWIAAAVRDGRADAGLGGFEEDALLAAIDYEGVPALLEWRLRRGVGWDELPGDFRGALATRARAAVVRSLALEDELRRIASVLDVTGLAVLLLKGPALARWLYPAPHLRAVSDIDLLFASRTESDRAARALEPLGYRLAYSPGRFTYEMTCLPVEGIGRRHEIDLHCRLVQPLVFAEALGFDELWEASMSLEGLGGMRRLGTEHALLHACLHRAMDMVLRRPDSLKWRYDIHLLLARMDAQAWLVFGRLAERRHLAGLSLQSLNDAIETFGGVLPADVAVALANAERGEPVDWRRLGNWRYMQWRNLQALPSVGQRIRWIWERLFPARGYMAALAGSGNWISQMGRRLRRLAGHLLGRP